MESRGKDEGYTKKLEKLRGMERVLVDGDEVDDQSC